MRFRNPVHRQRAGGQTGSRFREGRKPYAVENDFLVDVVAHDRDSGMPPEDFRQPGVFPGRVDGPGRIAGRIEQYPSGAAGDALFGHGGGDFETGVGGAWDGYRRSAGDFHHFGIADPGRGRDEHFVARFDGRQDGVEDQLFGAGSGDHVFRPAGDPVFSSELFRRGFAQGRCSGGGGVAGLSVGDRPPCRFGDVFRRGEIRLADIQLQDFRPLHFQAGGHAGDSRGSRLPGPCDAAGDFHERLSVRRPVSAGQGCGQSADDFRRADADMDDALDRRDQVLGPVEPSVGVIDDPAFFVGGDFVPVDQPAERGFAVHLVWCAASGIPARLMKSLTIRTDLSRSGRLPENFMPFRVNWK